MTEPARNSRPAGRSGGKTQKKFFHKKKFCRFCSDSDIVINYKDPGNLRNYVTERGKIMPRRITGNCAKHQREITIAVKRARMIALLPFIVKES